MPGFSGQNARKNVRNFFECTEYPVNHDLVSKTNRYGRQNEPVNSPPTVPSAQRSPAQGKAPPQGCTGERGPIS
jgi:hypothetical protein